MAGSAGEPSRLEAITTRWTLLCRARGGPDALAEEARNSLVLRYTPAIRRYVGAVLQNDQDADDVAQDVVVRMLSGDFAGADPQRGRFRDLLKVAIRNMVRNRWAQQKRRKNVDLDIALLSDGQDDEDRQRWLAEWRQSVLDLAWKALEQYEKSRPGSVAYTLLRLRTDHPEDSSDQLAERLTQAVGRPVGPEAFRQRLHRARSQFADLLIAEVAKGLQTPTPESIQEELAALELLDFLPPESTQKGSD
jgi:RNA polymerase sigma factor (sigma-70 family)